MRRGHAMRQGDATPNTTTSSPNLIHNTPSLQRLVSAVEYVIQIDNDTMIRDETRGFNEVRGRDEARVHDVGYDHLLTHSHLRCIITSIIDSPILITSRHPIRYNQVVVQFTVSKTRMKRGDMMIRVDAMRWYDATPALTLSSPILIG